MLSNKLKLLPCTFLLSMSLLSQQSKEVSHYLLPDFTPGTVLMKNGTRNPALLNYNAASEEMIFDQNGQKLALANPTLGLIDSVFIADKTFVRQSNKFMEVLFQKDFQLFAEHKCRVTPPPKPAAYGGTSETSSVDTYSSWSSDGRMYNLQLPDDFKVRPYAVYWLRKDGKMRNFVSMGQIRKFYAKKKKQLKTYEETNKTDFEDAESITKLFQFMESQ